MSAVWGCLWATVWQLWWKLLRLDKNLYGLTWNIYLLSFLCNNVKKQYFHDRILHVKIDYS